MSKKLIFLLFFLLILPIGASADIVINEIAWMGTESSSNDEWIELYSDEEIDLTGWLLEAIDGSPSINLEGTIAANSYFLLERTDDTSVPNITADQIYAGASSNAGEYLKLENNSNNVIDEVNATNGWPAGDNTTKQTMQLVDSKWGTGDPTPKTANNVSEEPPSAPEETPEGESETPLIPSGDNNPPIADAGDNIIGFVNQEIEFDGTNSSDPDEDELFCSWNMGDGKIIDKPSFTYKYSYPGTYLVTLTISDSQDYALDTITIEIKPQQIIINEFIPNPEGKDEENEWIEIYNDSNIIVDISEWQLDDEVSGSHPFVFPENTLIAPKSYIVFSRQITKIALNNDKDSVRLLLPEGVVFQEINYEEPKEGQSSAHTDEGFVWSAPTPGLANIVSPPINMGLGGEEKFVYQQLNEPETTEEPSEDYSWYYNQPEQEIGGGYTFLPVEEQPKADDQFAAISSFAKATEDKLNNQTVLNLVLIIVAVVLAGLIIGLFLTKLSKKFP